MKHTHKLRNAPEKDKTYRVEYNGKELYDAKILEYDGGCWAKIKIENIVPSENDKMYKVGQEFDLKLGYYKFYEAETNQ
ncbi:MAG: hypothetical protein WBQ38_15005 [Ignavibacteria bacterium]|nr:hypothetical protein [Ignavibacteria bacterium]MBK6772646.1 hypothetical protein [Ignavibacteria bacterium]MBK7158826.1 hypothetical protein [Ignavibacteria bacterium]MBK7254466.1 hypothetical protein [Ignavibacteria bacterium]MBK7447264.1 hypothetical protein [Ignavibacteria bacterium]